MVKECNKLLKLKRNNQQKLVESEGDEVKLKTKEVRLTRELRLELIVEVAVACKKTMKEAGSHGSLED